MTLLVFHHHYRPGGVRRVIELGLPGIVGRAGLSIDTVWLVGGEAPEAAWLERLQSALRPVQVEVRVDAALGYASEQRSRSPRAATDVRRVVERLAQELAGREVVFWGHNPSLARNAPATRAWVRAGERHGWRLVFHHHDWWFDNRWQRWPELKRAGLGTLSAAARWILSPAAGMRHAAINGEDAAPLVRALGARAGWLPNPVEAAVPCRATEVRQARRWLREQAGVAGPVWILPCRLLRRKNVAEALLLTRWLRPEACLITTGGVSSADEARYARALAECARKESWGLRLGVLAGGGARAPEVPALMEASEVVLLTSLVEGFGLPFVEACAARRPLVARSLSNVGPDLARWGFTFPHLYGEVMVSPDLFDWRREHRRQEVRYARWRAALPGAVRRWAGVPWLLAAGVVPAAVPMSRLTLRAQLEVLRSSVDESWAACAPLNPFLAAWRELASRGQMQPGTWPLTATRRLGSEAYGDRFASLVRARGSGRQSVSQEAVSLAQRELLQRKVESANLYPLLWSCQP